MTGPTPPVKELPLERIFSRTPLHRALGVEITRMEGGVVLKGTVGAAFARADGLDSLHGGAIATLLDSATNFAILAETGRPWATLDFRVDYLRPTKLGPIEVRATVVQAGATIGRSRAELRDSTGKLTAVATATMAGDRSLEKPASTGAERPT
jgi:uncharacterized protein (TIGR00369 family)